MPNRIILAGIVLAALCSFILWRITAAPTPAASVEAFQTALLEKDILTASSTPHTITVSSASGIKAVKVPILVYHIVRPARDSDSSAVKTFLVTPELFDEELSWLARNGYHVIPLSALEQYFASGTPLVARPVIITVDDAWASQYTYAFPTLEKYGDTATFFVPSNFPGSRGFLTWDELRTMIAAGMTVGDHSMSHPYLTQITSTTTLWKEIDGSKTILERELGVPITEFNYPFGAYNAAIVAMVKKAGYKAARTDAYGVSGVADNLFTLPALNAPTTLATFEKYFPP